MHVSSSVRLSLKPKLAKMVVSISAVKIVVNYVEILDELPPVVLKYPHNYCCIRVASIVI